MRRNFIFHTTIS